MNFLNWESSSTRGHPYKIFKRRTSCTTRSEFFAERVVNTWNALPLNVVDFSSLIAFKRSIEKRSICLHSVQLYRLFAHKAALTFSFISSAWLCFIVFMFVCVCCVSLLHLSCVSDFIQFVFLLRQYLVLYSALLSCLDYCLYSLIFFSCVVVHGK